VHTPAEIPVDLLNVIVSDCCEDGAVESWPKAALPRGDGTLEKQW